MGTYQNGILGSFNGKVGPIVGANWKDVNYMRSKGRKTTKGPSLKQLEHRVKFSLVSKFVHKIGALLMKYYPATSELTSINHAFANIYGKAITGAYPLFELDYSRILISRGELHNCGVPQVRLTGNGMIEFSWIDNTDNLMANADDRCLVLVYCPEMRQCVYTNTGSIRKVGKENMNASYFTGKLVETWITFISADDKIAATSIYTGQFMIV